MANSGPPVTCWASKSKSSIQGIKIFAFGQKT